MKFILKALCTASLIVGSVGAAQASAVVNNWFFNPGAGGLASARNVHEYLDTTGNAFIQITSVAGSSFSFTEYATFFSGSIDSNHGYNPNDHVTAIFQATGTGTFGGSFSFSAGGTLRVFDNPNANFTSGGYASDVGIYGADNGPQIATFTVLAGGGGNVNNSGSPTGQGQVSVNLQALQPGSLVPGHFFSPTGGDLSATDVLAFAFTQANTQGDVDALQVSEIICQGANYQGAGCTSGTYANGADHFFLNNNGTFKLATVPEPSSVALVGLAFVGASIARRRVSAKKT